MDSDLAKDFEQQVKKATAHLRQSIPVPTDGTEDHAVEAVIREYRERTGIELDEPVIRAEVRRLRAGGPDETA
jgi:8-oxo-dGTP pyrophosphatase MutT (NUDIX family)